MIIGTGVDIVKIKRFAEIANRSVFMEKIFTAGEREYLKTRNPESTAGLFAAKEAVVKAMGTGFSGFFPRDIEVVHDERGKPGIVLHDAARAVCAENVKIHVSISHSSEDAVAFAVAEECYVGKENRFGYLYGIRLD